MQRFFYILLLALCVVSSGDVQAKDFFNFTKDEFRERIAVLMDKSKDVLIIPKIECRPITYGSLRYCETKVSRNLTFHITEIEKEGDVETQAFIKGAAGNVYEVSASLNLTDKFTDREGQIFDSLCISILAAARNVSLDRSAALFSRLSRNMANRFNYVDTIEKEDKDKKTMSMFSLSFSSYEMRCLISAEDDNFL